MKGGRSGCGRQRPAATHNQSPSLALGSRTSSTSSRGIFVSRPTMFSTTDFSSREWRAPSKRLLPLCGSVVVTVTSKPLKTSNSKSRVSVSGAPGVPTSSSNSPAGKSAAPFASSSSSHEESALFRSWISCDAESLLTLTLSSWGVQLHPRYSIPISSAALEAIASNRPTNSSYVSLPLLDAMTRLCISTRSGRKRPAAEP
mmetsp:Transcript_2427/g.5933  ORF Transcript_2427/g.5933 Transcript_2427/m.5933 type:complete len:201 (-) Transcript_2427:3-605(-)